MKLIHIVICTVILLSSCKSFINTNYEYQKLISPKLIKADIEILKKDLIKNHYNINWENKQDNILEDLNQIKNIETHITLDSFERRISKIINFIDDGHSSVYHQIKNEKKNANFGTNRITDSIHYLKIANFIESEKLRTVLLKFKSSFEENPCKNVVIDIRFNHGGSIENVNYFLSFFLPSNTELYDRLDAKSYSIFSKLSSFILNLKYNLNNFKTTQKKKLNGSPNIFLIINEKIASGSMLSSYHLQNNGAYIIGETPKGLFNTFGNTRGYKLRHSKIVYGLASTRIFLSKEAPKRMEDMLRPDYEPDKKMNINQIVDYINNYTKIE